MNTFQVMLMTQRLTQLIESLQLDSEILTVWFKSNVCKLNLDKCKLLISNKENDLSINIDG